MAVYAYSDEQIEKMIAGAKRLRVSFCLTASAIVVAVVLLWFFYPDLPGFQKPWFFALFTTLFVVPLLQNIWRWNTWSDKARNSLRTQSVDISNGAVIVTYPSSHKRQLDQREILRAEEPSLGGGLYLRTANRYRWLLIPRKLDGYEAVKHELNQMGIAVVKTSILPNWEEFLGVLVVVATLVCTMVAHSVQVLTVNLVVAVLVSLAGLFVINAYSDAMPQPKMRMARFGAFLPVIFAAAGLLLVVYG